MVTADALYRLMTWLSPAYPVGGFSYSHGIEAAVEQGLVHDRDSLARWVAHILHHGGGFTDAVIFTAAWRAADDADELYRIADFAAAFRGTGELALETTQQGDAFLTVTRRAWPDPRLDALVARRAGTATPLPVAVGLACAGTVPLDAALAAYLQAFAANLVSAGVRLVPLGQTDGQLALAALAAGVGTAAKRALATDLDDIGAAAPMVDWTSMFHETQYTRLFRS